MITKFSNWYFTKKTLPHWGILVLDSLIVAFTVLVSAYMELGGETFAHHLLSVLLSIPIIVLLFVISFRVFHTYTGIMRYSTFVDLQRVALATLGGSSLTLLVSAMTASFPSITMPRLLGVGTIFILTTLIMWLERITVKRLFDGYRIDNAMPVAIYGTKAGGISLAKSISSVSDKQYRLVAFISDDEKMKNVYLMGKKVFPNQVGIAERMKELGVTVLLVSPLKNELFRNNFKMVDEFLTAGITIKMMPAAEEWDGKSDLTHQHLHDVEIEDLLPREKIEVDMNAIGALLTGKKILITGAAGSIGSEMVRQVAIYKPAEMILIDQAETPMHDIRLMMNRLFADIPNETIVSSITN